MPVTGFDCGRPPTDFEWRVLLDKAVMACSAGEARKREIASLDCPKFRRIYPQLFDGALDSEPSRYERGAKD